MLHHIMTRLIRLQSAGCYYGIVDDDIYPFISHFRWYRKFPYADIRKTHAYRITSMYPAKQTTVSMHKEVVRFHKLGWLQILHHNGDGLDNRLENLVPKFSVVELDRRANALREYQKVKAIRNYWNLYRNN